MPNWCNNVVKIKGPKADIETLLKRANDAQFVFDPEAAEATFFFCGAGWEGNQWFSFHAFVPIPDELIESGDQRDWLIDHWDTKWDAEVACVSWSKSGKIAYVDFMTAWGPPESVIKAMREQFPKLEISCKWKSEDGTKGTC